MIKHNYTNELELKSLLIRVKHTRFVDNTTKTSITNVHDDKISLYLNKRINKYIKWYTNILNTKSTNGSKSLALQKKLKAKIISLSENTLVDKTSYDRFGYIILLMIKRIMTKPQFNGYTYKDDFTSDAVYKILKYLDNFDHTIISKNSGQFVSSFAYITQIIHNSIKYIINCKKADVDFLKEQVMYQKIALNMEVDCNDNYVIPKQYDMVVTVEDSSTILDRCNSLLERNKDTNILIEYYDTISDIDTLSKIHELMKEHKNLSISKIKRA